MKMMSKNITVLALLFAVFLLLSGGFAETSQHETERANVPHGEYDPAAYYRGGFGSGFGGYGGNGGYGGYGGNGGYGGYGGYGGNGGYGGYGGRGRFGGYRGGRGGWGGYNEEEN